MDTSQDVLKKTFYLSNGSEEQIFMNNLESHLLISSNGEDTYAHDPEKSANRYKSWETSSQAHSVAVQKWSSLHSSEREKLGAN